MIKIETMHPAKPSDTELVANSLGGNREAFRQIVERYKTLVCSVAYCATGNVSQSEDLAQETFVTAWGNLSLLREPAKLRGWLCGIVRHRTQKYWHRAGHDLTHNAAPLEEAYAQRAPEELPSEQAVTRDEEALLWRAVEKIPEIYREPLVLFYREHRSIEQVASALDLSEDAIKQRLSRGRKLLQEEVQAFVESALHRSAPKSAFVNSVFAALPILVTPATTAVAVGTTAKGAAATKAGLAALWLVPMIGSFGGFGAQWLALRATTPDRKMRAIQMRGLIIAWVLILAIAVGGEWAIESLGRNLEWSDRFAFAAKAVFWWLYSCGLIAWVIASVRRSPALCGLEINPSAPPMRPMKRSAYIAMVTGTYLSLGSWLAGLAWHAHDSLAMSITAGLLVVLGIGHCWHVFRRTGNSATRASLGHTALAAGMMLLIFNLRFELWLAVAHGVNLTEINLLRPMWIIPVLTLSLLVWVAMVLYATTPKHGGK